MTQAGLRFVLILLAFPLCDIAHAQDRTDHWVPVGPTVPAGIHSISLVPSNSAIVYAATDAGIDESANEGSSWVSFAGELPVASYSSVAVDPNDVGVVYAVEAGGPLFKLVPGQRLSRNWIQLDVRAGGANTGQIFDAVYVGLDANSTLYLHSPSRGLTISRDGGMTWSDFNEGLQGGLGVAISFDPSEPTRVYAVATNVGPVLFLSSDSGRTWNELASEGGFPDDATVLAVDPVEPNLLVASGIGGLSRSEDGGLSWSSLAAYPELSAVSVAFDSAGDTLFASSPLGNIYESLDQGTSWRLAFDGGGVARSITLVSGADDDSRVYAAATTDSNRRNGGLLVSDDGGSDWSLATIDNDREPLGVSDFAIAPSDPRIIYAMTDGETLFRSDDAGQSWREIPCAVCLGSEAGALLQILIHPILPIVLYARSQSSVFVSFDGAATWTESHVSESPLSLNELVADIRAPGRLFLATDSGVFRSDDGAMSWTASASNPFPTSITSVLIDPTDSDILYAGSNAYQQPDGSFSSFLFKSTDGGISWLRLPFAFPADLEVDPVAIDPTNSSVIYAGLSSPIACPFASSHGSAHQDGTLIGELEKSTDGARTWQTTGLTQSTSVSSFALDPEDPNRLFAFVDSGCFFDRGPLEGSLDGGASWDSADRGLPSGQVNELRFDPMGRTLYCGSAAGLFALDRTVEVESIPPPAIGAPAR